MRCSHLFPERRDQRNLIPLGISPKYFRNASDQFSGSRPFWLRKAEAHPAASGPEWLPALGLFCEALGVFLPVHK